MKQTLPLNGVMCRHFAPWTGLFEGKILMHRLNQTAQHPGLYSVPMQKALVIRLMRWLQTHPRMDQMMGTWGMCPFFDRRVKQCRIYDLRPMLCRTLVPRKERIVKLRLVYALSLPALMVSWYAKRFGVALKKWPDLAPHFRVQPVLDVDIAQIVRTHRKGYVKPKT